MMPSALSVFLTHFPEFRGTEIAERSGPMTVEGFRSYLDFPDPLEAIDPNAVQALDQNLKDLVLNALRHFSAMPNARALGRAHTSNRVQVPYPPEAAFTNATTSPSSSFVFMPRR